MQGAGFRSVTSFLYLYFSDQGILEGARFVFPALVHVAVDVSSVPS